MAPTDTVATVGVVGTGGLGTRMLADLADVPRARTVAVADVDEEARHRAGDRFDVPPGSRYADYEAMLDGEGLDAVVVTTPHSLHHEQVVAAMERGLHVYCEKPLTTSLADARDLVERDAAREEVLMVGYQRHLDPAFRRGRERWAEGDREPRFLTAEITQNLFGAFADAWYLDPELSGGGQIYATGTHLIDAVLWMTGLDPVAVTASLDLDDCDRLDRHAALTVEFDTGAVATLGISGDTPRTREHVHGWDGDGALYVEGREWDQRTVTVVDADGTEHSPHVAGADRTKARAFVDCVLDGERPPATALDAYRATAVQEAAYEAHHAGERVAVDADPGV